MTHEPNRGIEIRLDANRGELTLICGAESFRRLRDHVVADAGCTNGVDGVRVIIIEDALRWGREKPNWVRDRMWLVGCAIVAFIFAFVLIIGTVAIVNGIRQL